MKPGDYPLALWPPAASASAVETDHLIWAFTLLTLLLVVPIFVGITFFAIRYQDGRAVNRGFREDRDRLLELSWMIIPFVLTLIFFGWGAQMFIVHKTPPANATQIEAIGRQWMWKFQHPGGQAEINDLHLPIGEPVVINMISQDVIHSLYIPSLRIQMETLPGRLHAALVPGRPPWDLPDSLQRVLRHRPFGDGGAADADDAGGLRRLAIPRQHQWQPGAGGGQAVRIVWLRRLP